MRRLFFLLIAAASVSTAALAAKPFATGYIAPSEEQLKKAVYFEPAVNIFSALPEEFDATEEGYLPYVINQGSCGSCWACTRTQLHESARRRAGLPFIKLSIQDMLSNTDYGCRGGFMNGAWEVKYGQRADADCPYRGNDRIKCRASAPKISKPSSWGIIGGYNRSATPTEIKTALVKYKVLGITISGDGGRLYPNASGVITRCSARNVDHMVAMYGYTKPDSTYKNGLFMIQNSWGSKWGKEGRAKLPLGCNMAATGRAAVMFEWIPDSVRSLAVGDNGLPIELETASSVEVKRGESVTLTVKAVSGNRPVAFEWGGDKKGKVKTFAKSSGGADSSVSVTPKKDTVYTVSAIDRFGNKTTRVIDVRVD